MHGSRRVICKWWLTLGGCRRVGPTVGSNGPAGMLSKIQLVHCYSRLQMLRTILLDQCLNSFMVEPHPSTFYVHLMNAPRPSLYFFLPTLPHLCTVISNQRIKEKKYGRFGNIDTDSQACCCWLPVYILSGCIHGILGIAVLFGTRARIYY